MSSSLSRTHRASWLWWGYYTDLSVSDSKTAFLFRNHTALNREKARRYQLAWDRYATAGRRSTCRWIQQQKRAFYFINFSTTRGGFQVRIDHARRKSGETWEVETMIVVLFVVGRGLDDSLTPPLSLSHSVTQQTLLTKATLPRNAMSSSNTNNAGTVCR
jgi:hypothetical protein